MVFCYGGIPARYSRTRAGIVCAPLSEQIPAERETPRFAWRYLKHIQARRVPGRLSRLIPAAGLFLSSLQTLTSSAAEGGLLLLFLILLS